MNDKDRKIDIMGIINITDDSYFSESRCLDADGTPNIDLVARKVERMVSEGANIIDIGACSTRPGSSAVGELTEWERLAPVVSLIGRMVFGQLQNVSLSVDTWWASVAEKTFALLLDVAERECVAHPEECVRNKLIINDISAGEDDPAMLPAIGRMGVRYIAMHKRGTSETMQSLCSYVDVVRDVIDYFRDFERRASDTGIKDWILDPGFGFAKTVEQNYSLMSHLDEFNVFGRRIIVGVSRKSMIYRLFGMTPEESLPQTQVLHLASLIRGADILRVHDVAEAARTVELYRRLF